ncbi:MAG: DUF4837 family protein [Bacteroidetes bacterium]|nr:MAG: DUF4837 family protein [Bacteroidota bacterium]
MRYIIPLLLLLTITLSGCNQRYDAREFGLKATGKVGEILLVCENGIWNSPAKAYLDTNMTRFIMPYFPDVVTFELIHRTPGAFEKGNKRWRNLMFVEIDPKYQGEESEITKELDTWAQGQLVVRVKAKDYQQLEYSLKNHLAAVHRTFDENEWQRLEERFQREKNQTICRQIKQKFGLDMALPKGSKLVTQRENFYRVEFPTDAKPMQFGENHGQTSNFIQSGICIYQYPYIDSSQFELSNLLQARDTMMKYNFKHEIPGIYMGTQYASVIYPEGSMDWNRKKTTKGFEMRGMFKFTGESAYSTGGAFWAFHFRNKQGKLVCVSGYVDAPPTVSWTHPLREIQAILKSVEAN